MAWTRSEFKGRKVWAASTTDGVLRADGGRVAIRYSDKEGATIYQAGASRVQALADGPTRDLPSGAAAKPSSGGGGANTRSGGKSSGSGYGSAGRRSVAQQKAAVASVSEVIAALPTDAVRAFTDGACIGNPGPCGAGALVVFPDGRRQERARDLGHGTNNVGELTALRLALDIFDESDVAPEAHVALFTDSKYAIGVLMQGWKAKANRELILDLRDRFARRSGARLFWVPGHAGVAENERADVLASGAARGVEVG